LKDWVKNEFAGKGVLMTAGAVDIDLLVEPIKEIIK
jgi:hypothetical protein